MKGDIGSQNSSYLDNGVHYTELPKPQKSFTATFETFIKESDQKFFIRYYIILVFVFINNFIYSTLYSASVLLITSIALLLFLIVFSLLSIICSQSEEFLRFKKIFNDSNLVIVTGFAFIIIDPNFIGNLSLTKYKPFLSSLQTLILLYSMTYRFHESSAKFFTLTQFFAAVSFILSLYFRPDTTDVFYELFELSCFISIGGLYITVSSTQKSAKIGSIGPVVSGVEEITNNLDKIIEKISNLNENPDQKSNLPHIIQDIKSVNQMIRNTPNIYSAQMNSVLKGIDQDDGIFLEQACFGSNSISYQLSVNLNIPKKSVIKNSYGIELQSQLNLIGKDWNFNTFLINECTGNPLQITGIYVIRTFSIDKTFEIEEVTATNFLKEMELKYEKNPYHNSLHAVDVMCSLLFLIQNSMLFDHISSLELLALVLAALAHDIGHPGKNNRFIVMSHDEIALIYNDISVLEMMHASKLFQILKNPEANILSYCKEEEFALIRKDIIDMVLSTDMGKHFELLGQFKAKYLSTDLHDITARDTKIDLFKLIMKAADIGHAAKSIELHEKWCNLVIQEFFDQGDLEKSLGLPISMYCDRDTTDICKSQSGFIKNIVSPLFTSLNTVLISQEIETTCIQQLILNQQHWDNKKKYSRGQSAIISAEDILKRLHNKSNLHSSLPEFT